MAANYLLLLCLYEIQAYLTQATAVPKDCESNYYLNKVSQLCDPCPITCLMPRYNISTKDRLECQDLVWSAGFCIGVQTLNTTNTYLLDNGSAVNGTALSRPQMAAFHPVALGIFAGISLLLSIASIAAIVRYVLKHRQKDGEPRQPATDTSLPLIPPQLQGINGHSDSDSERNYPPAAEPKSSGLPTSFEVDESNDDQPGPSARPLVVEPAPPPDSGQKAVQDPSTEVADGEERCEVRDALERIRLGDVESKPTDFE